MWDHFMPGDADQVNINIFGNGRPIRSDEWYGTSIALLAQAKNPDFFPLINNHLGSGVNKFVAGAPVFHISLVGRPQYWGFILLGAEKGFSWFWIFSVLLLFFTSFELIKYLTKNHKGYALTGAVLITFSPFVQWWLVEGFIKLISFFQLILVCLITYFKVHRSLSKRILCLAGMAVGMCGYALIIIPGVQWPLFLIMLIFIAGILWENREKILMIDWLMAGCCIAFVAAVLGYSVYQSWEDFQVTSGIPQADRFFLPGRYDIRHQLYEYISLALPFRDVTPFFSNNCEISRFVTLMPLTLFLFPFLLPKIKRIKDIPSLPVLIYILLIILSIWAYIPMPKSIGTLFSMVMLLLAANRIQILIGLLGVYLLVISLALRDQVKLSLEKKLMFSLFTICSILYVIYTPQVMEYLWSDYNTTLFKIGTRVMIIIFVLCALFLIWGKQKWCAIILSVCIFITGIMVNPLARGLDPIYNKPISREVERIRNEEPDARWISVTTLPQSAVPAFGVNSFNFLQLTPFLSLWEKFDPEGRYTHAYNRYGFVSVRFTNEDTFFIEQGNHVILFMNLRDLHLADAQYIFTDANLDSFNDEIPILNKVYEDSSEHRIYRIGDLASGFYMRSDQ
jgi:hypothetical protein